MGHHDREREKDRSGSSHKHKREDKDREERKHSSKEKDKDRKRDKHSSSRSHKNGSSSSSKRSKDGSKIVDDDDDGDEDMWIEKGQEEPASVTNIPTSASLSLTSKASPSSRGPPLPGSTVSETATREKRDEWMLSDDVHPPQANAPMRQSDNHTYGGTFSVGDMPTGIARPNTFNTIGEFTDGYGEGDADDQRGAFGGAVARGGGDFFSSIGEERKRKEIPKRKDADAPKMSSKEINTAIYAEDGSRLASSTEAISGNNATPSTSRRSEIPAPGSTGSNWRMMKLKRAIETAQEENRSVEEVGVERFGTIELFEAAKDERIFLDERGGRSGSRTPGSAGLQGRRITQQRPGYGRSGTAGSDTGSAATAEEDSGLDEFGRERRPAASTADTPSATRYIFTDPASASSSRPPSRQSSFRRPGSYAEDGSRPTTPVPQQQQSRPSKPSTPIPSVFTPTAGAMRKPSQLQTSTLASEQQLGDSVASAQRESMVSEPAISSSELNKMQAQILRMRLLGGDSDELKQLEEKYERESLRARQGDAAADEPTGYFESMAAPGTGGQETEVRVLPTLDARGRLYDVGRGDTKEEDEQANLPGNKRKRKEKYFETRDTKTGELLRYNADDDTMTLEEMVRQERFAAGSGDQKNLDAEMASRIAGDQKFEDDLDYMDDSADRLARKKLKTDTQKKLFAINDYARTKKALESCQFCYQDTEHSTVPPQAAMVALGTRAYLALPLFEELVEGHTVIVPLQHHLSMLEADGDTWEEVKNFMKTLMQYHASRDCGVFFYETVLSHKGQRHTCIECVPVPFLHFDELPAYFREGILSIEAEWSQHKKLIDFSSRPGGFRRMMVPNLPYFMCQWDYKGEKGYGHVIEGPEKGTGEGDSYDFDEGAKGGGEFPRYFAAEIIGSVLDLEPRLWRRPKRMDRKLNSERVKRFRDGKNGKGGYDQYDWTKMLEVTADQQ